MRTNVYEYKNLQDFLIQLYESKRTKNPNFSIRSWSKKLGYESSSFIGQVISGKRKANIKLIDKITDSESLSSDERVYLLFLSLKQKLLSEDIESEYDSVLDILKDKFSNHPVDKQSKFQENSAQL